MTIEIKAPDLTPGYPSRGPKLGQAWRDIYAQLTKDPEAWQDGYALIGPMAAKHDLTIQTLRVFMSRAARYGVLRTQQMRVQSEVVRTSRSGKRSTFASARMHTHYQINPEYVDNLRPASRQPLDRV